MSGSPEASTRSAQACSAAACLAWSRRVDLEAALGDRVGREVLEQQVAHIVGEVGVGALGVGELAGVERDLLGDRRVVLLLRDVARLEHAREDEVAAVLAVLVVREGVVVGGRVGDAHEGRRLVQGEVGGALVEVGDRGGFDAVGAVAVEDGVEVHVQDLVLGVRLLHLDGDVGLANLAAQRVLELLVGEDRPAHELLRDRGAAALLAAAEHLAHGGTGDALGVNAVVLVEALVLGVDGALDDVVGDLVERHGATVLQVVRHDLVAVGVVDARGLGDEEGVGGGVVGQVLEPGGHHGPQRERERHAEKRDEAEHPGEAEAHEVRLRVGPRTARSDSHEPS